MNQNGKDNAQWEVVTNHRCLLGEGPVWDSSRNLLYWLDIIAGEIHEYDPQQGTHRMLPVHQMVGSIAVCTNGKWVAGLKEGFGFIHRETGWVEIIARPEAHLGGNRFNEGKCDPAGRFWAGTMSISEDTGAGSVYCLDKQLSVTKKIENVSISNGMAWSADFKRFFYIDTPRFEIDAYDYEKETGEITGKKTIIVIPTADGYPDGMTIDNEGKLWVAHWDGWKLTRWDPDTGKKILEFRLPAAKITSCTFGGKDLSWLYITSASVGLTDEQKAKQPLAGALFVMKNTGFTGVPAFEFDH